MKVSTTMPVRIPLPIEGWVPGASSLSNSSFVRKVRLLLTVILGVAVMACAAIPAWRHLYPAVASSDWGYEVYLGSVERASALIPDGQGGLLVSQEMPNGKGRILRVKKSGETEQVFSGLSKPDGLASYRGGIAFSQEQGVHPVMWKSDLGTRKLFSANSVEGLISDGRYLYAIEDLHGTGRLLRYDFDSDQVTTLRAGLDEAEAIAHCPDGRMFYTEKTQGHVRQLTVNGDDPIVLNGLREPGFLLCNQDGLWITEDATHMSRVLLWKGLKSLDVVLSHLRSPQTIVETSSGQYLVAEEGRNRILKLQRKVSF